MPPAVGAALVLAQDADAAEADLFVGPDGPLVRGGRIDRDPMVAADLEEVLRYEADGRRAEAPALPGRPDEESMPACM